MPRILEPKLKRLSGENLRFRRKLGEPVSEASRDRGIHQVESPARQRFPFEDGNRVCRGCRSPRPLRSAGPIRRHGAREGAGKARGTRIAATARLPLEHPATLSRIQFSVEPLQFASSLSAKQTRPEREGRIVGWPGCSWATQSGRSSTNTFLINMAASAEEGNPSTGPRSWERGSARWRAMPKNCEFSSTGPRLRKMAGSRRKRSCSTLSPIASKNLWTNESE